MKFKKIAYIILLAGIPLGLLYLYLAAPAYNSSGCTCAKEVDCSAHKNHECCEHKSEGNGQ